jgi:hypothetical protein
MAIVAAPTATLSFTWKDASGSIGHTDIHVPDGTLAAVALTAAEALGALLAAMSDCVLLGYKLTYNRVENAPGSPVAGSRVEEKGNFIWTTADGRSTRFSIPAIKDTQLNASGSVNRSAVATAALIAGVTDVDAIFAGASGSDITAIAKAYQSFRSSTRNELPTDG